MCSNLIGLGAWFESGIILASWEGLVFFFYNASNEVVVTERSNVLVLDKVFSDKVLVILSVWNPITQESFRMSSVIGSSVS